MTPPPPIPSGGATVLGPERRSRERCRSQTQSHVCSFGKAPRRPASGHPKGPGGQDPRPSDLSTSRSMLWAKPEASYEMPAQPGSTCMHNHGIHFWSNRLPSGRLIRSSFNNRKPHPQRGPTQPERPSMLPVPTLLFRSRNCRN